MEKQPVTWMESIKHCSRIIAVFTILIISTAVILFIVRPKGSDQTYMGVNRGYNFTEYRITLKQPVVPTNIIINEHKLRLKELQEQYVKQLFIRKRIKLH